VGIGVGVGFLLSPSIQLGCRSVVMCLPYMAEAVGSIPQHCKRDKNSKANTKPHIPSRNSIKGRTITVQAGSH
jgi:hypothetical protein